MGNLLRDANFAITAFAVTGPMAHVLELPNKFTLDGPLWLAVQQQVYRGWGLVFGPVEILGLLTSLALVILRRHTPATFRPSLLAALAYGAMLASFFIFNAPVNSAFAGWTPATLPADWPDYRLRWELGHALSALFSIIAVLALWRAWWREHAFP